MEIPKLANGGIIDNKYSFILVDYPEESEHILPLLPSTKKSIQIYHRTKNRRIKKKQIKKAPILAIEIYMKKQLKDIKNKNITIKINGEQIKTL